MQTDVQVTGFFIFSKKKFELTDSPGQRGSIYPRVKSVQVRSYFWSIFSCIRTEYGPEIIPYLDTFHAVKCLFYLCIISYILMYYLLMYYLGL